MFSIIALYLYNGDIFKLTHAEKLARYKDCLDWWRHTQHRWGSTWLEGQDWLIHDQGLLLSSISWYCENEPIIMHCKMLKWNQAKSCSHYHSGITPRTFITILYTTHNHSYLIMWHISVMRQCLTKSAILQIEILNLLLANPTRELWLTNKQW